MGRLGKSKAKSRCGRRHTRLRAPEESGEPVEVGGEGRGWPSSQAARPGLGQGWSPTATAPCSLAEQITLLE